jgi:hypothetical protein
MAKRFNEEHSMQDILKEFIQVNKLDAGMDKIDVEQAWKNLMGNGVNNYTEEVLLKRTTLYVKLSSTILKNELGYGKDKIIRMINEEMGKEVVKSIVLR